MNEIEVKKYTLPKLEIENYEEIKKAVEEDNKKYKNYIVTKESLEADTKKRAELRNQAKAIDNRRKEIEKEISAPIKQFKADCDLLKKMYEQSADNLDVQIKVYEAQEKEKKKDNIQKLFDDLINKSAISSLINLDMLFDERYLNKTYELKDIEKDLNNKIEKITNDIEVIKDLKSEYEVSLTNTYLKNFDLGYVISENKRLQELKEKSEKVEEKKEVLRQEKIEETLTKPVEIEEIDPIKTYTLKITGTYTQQQNLKRFLKLNNMKVERVD